MRIEFLQLSDRHLGRLICWLLTGFMHLGRLLGRESISQKPNRTVIIKLAEMGSTILALPAIEHLKKHIADGEFFFLVFAENVPVVKALSIVPSGNVIEIDFDSPMKLIASTVKAIARLRKEGVDTAINFDLFIRLSASLAFLSGSRRRVGFHSFKNEGVYQGNLMTRPVIYNCHVHVSQAFLSLAKAATSDAPQIIQYQGRIDAVPLKLPAYSPDEDALASVRSKLKEIGTDIEAPLVLVNTNSSGMLPLRRWPVDCYSELCRKLLKSRPDIYIIALGSPSERGVTAELVSAIDNKRFQNMAGSTTFPELLALCSLADAIVTSDSGPAHFASLLNLPSVVLFGPETSRLYSPINSKTKCVSANFACSPCLSAYNIKESACKDNACMKAITVDQVFNELLKIIPC